MIFKRFPIERQAFVVSTGFGGRGRTPYILLVEAAFRFVAEPLALQHLAKETRDLQVAALVVYVLRQVRNYVAEDVEADQIDRPERGGARPAHGLAGERVDLFDAQV